MFHSEMTARKITYSVVFLGIILFLSFSTFLFQQETRNPKLPILGELQNFLLFDPQGRPVNWERLKGKVWVADFIFTSCSGICPVMTQNMVKLHRMFLEDDRVHMVSISVDPETDSPDVLARYARKYKVDTEKWYFLTGPRDTIQSLSVRSFKIGSVQEPIFHSDRFVLVDPKMRIRGYYDGTRKEDLEAIARDILILLKERPS
jgi:protein SCO1/2